MKKSTFWGIVVGLISGIFATLTEAFVALNKSLYILWPWIGIYLYLPGLFVTYITVWLFTRWLQSTNNLERNYGVITGVTSMLTFFIFDNLIVFPIFVAPIVWPWQDFFFNFRFPAGLSDTLANGIIIFFIGCWFEKKLFPEVDEQIKSYARVLLKDATMAFLLLLLLAIPVWAYTLYVFQTSVQGVTFFKDYILYGVLIGGIILEILWTLEYLQLRRIASTGSVAENFRQITLYLVIIAIVNGTAFYFSQLFLYPFGEGALNNLLPLLPGFVKLLMTTYLAIVTYQLILLLLILTMLLLLKEVNKPKIS